MLTPLVKVINLLEKKATAVLTPHLTIPVNDGLKPDEGTMLQVGVYNLGFIGLSHTQEARRLIDWWCQRLERGCLVDLEAGLFGDQKWADLMPCLFEGVEILRSPAYNLAYWNLVQRKVIKEKGAWLVNQELLSFIHFSGIDPQNPASFSKHQNRFNEKNIGPIKEVYRNYLALLEKNLYYETIKIPYGYGYLLDGTEIHYAMRAYFRLFLDTGPYPIKRPLNTLTAAYFNTVEKKLPNNTLVTRFMYGLFLSKKNIQMKFKLNNPASQKDFAIWFSYFSFKEHQISEIFLEHACKLLKNTRGNQEITIIAKIKTYLTNLICNIYELNIAFFKTATRFFSQKVVKNIKNYLPYGHNDKTTINPPGKILKTLILKILASLAIRPNPTLKKSINVDTNNQAIESNLPIGATLVGHVFGDFGTAQALRAAANAFISINYPIDIIAISTNKTHSESDTSLEHFVVDESKNQFQLYFINADQTIALSEIFFSKKELESTYRIGYWFWELAKFPKEWLGAFDLVEEIWAPSRFIFDILSPISPKPVTYIPAAVSVIIEKSYNRAYFGLPEKTFLFLCYYDFHSFMERKNPEGAVKAFLDAFPDKENSVELVIKTINAEKHPQQYIQLLEMAQIDKRIHVMNKALSRNEMLNLMNNCDSLISLHRAEGFGFGLAEAMLLGKPVIGTGYSGNMDFMNSENSCVVNYSMIPVKQDSYLFWEGQHWAEPNYQQAAMYMKKLYEDKEYRQRIAAKGQAWIREKHSPTKIGEIMRERLDVIAKTE